MINIFLNKLIYRKNLTQKEAMSLMEEILRGNLTSAQIAAILVALRIKEETPVEILGFIKVMRKHMVKIKTSGLVIDVCGTGGDGKGTFNISTAVALVVAGAGIKVAKHGNRNA
ncbi:anthranilate phosphoribosyltransferase, partial [Candidatus Gottesmanbacteria bacterium]|nr:anthranilate phosphoribosyltransferase [Candidatus Gottesmanbacteria bacterium]